MLLKRLREALPSVPPEAASVWLRVPAVLFRSLIVCLGVSISGSAVAANCPSATTREFTSSDVLLQLQQYTQKPIRFADAAMATKFCIDEQLLPSALPVAIYRNKDFLSVLTRAAGFRFDETDAAVVVSRDGTQPSASFSILPESTVQSLESIAKQNQLELALAWPAFKNPDIRIVPASEASQATATIAKCGLRACRYLTTVDAEALQPQLKKFAEFFGADEVPLLQTSFFKDHPSCLPETIADISKTLAFFEAGLKANETFLRISPGVIDAISYTQMINDFSKTAHAHLYKKQIVVRTADTTFQKKLTSISEMAMKFAVVGVQTSPESEWKMSILGPNEKIKLPTESLQESGSSVSEAYLVYDGQKVSLWIDQALRREYFSRELLRVDSVVAKVYSIPSGIVRSQKDEMAFSEPVDVAEVKSPAVSASANASTSEDARLYQIDRRKVAGMSELAKSYRSSSARISPESDEITRALKEATRTTPKTDDSPFVKFTEEPVQQLELAPSKPAGPVQ